MGLRTEIKGVMKEAFLDTLRGKAREGAATLDNAREGAGGEVKFSQRPNDFTNPEERKTVSTTVPQPAINSTLSD